MTTRFMVSSLLILQRNALLLLSLLGIVLFAGSASVAFAQQEGIGLTPAMIEKTVDPNTEQDFTITVENFKNQEQVYYMFTRNIARVDDMGAPIFAKTNEERTGFEIADWITLSTTSVSVPGRGKKTVTFKLSVPESASPGSHLGGVFFSFEPPEMEGSGAAVGYQVPVVLSMRVSGDVVEAASIRQFSTSKFVYGSQDVTFNVRIENEGNVVVRPTGMIQINNMLGKEVGMIDFNKNEAAVIPKFVDEAGKITSQGLREYSDIVWTGDAVGFGRYEAVLSAVYGEMNGRQTITSTVTFWIIPFKIIGPIIAAFAFVILITFLIIKMYIRRSIARLSRGHRIVRRRQRGGSAWLLFSVVMLSVTALFLLVLLALLA